MASENTDTIRTDYLRPHQVEELEYEKDRIDEILSKPELVARIEDKSALHRQRKSLDEQIGRNTPPRLKPEDRDRVARRQEELEGKIRSIMCTAEEMRKCPPGAIGKFRSGENSAEGKRAILEWKQNQMLLHPQSNDPDLCNAERLRPRMNTLNMENAMIPGKDYYIPTGPIAARNVASDEDRERLIAERDAMAAELEALRKKTEKPKAEPIVMACGKKVKKSPHLHVKACEVCQAAEKAA